MLQRILVALRGNSQERIVENFALGLFFLPGVDLLAAVAYLLKQSDKKSPLLDGVSLASDCRRNVRHKPLMVGLGYFSDDFLSDLVIAVAVMFDGSLLRKYFRDALDLSEGGELL